MYQRKKTCIVAPLHWGLGHATRCIPIIKALMHRNCEVHIASDGASLKILKQNFPNLVAHQLPGYNIQYAPKALMTKLVLQIPKIFQTIRAEQVHIQKLVQGIKPDFIISDNRYGIYSQGIVSILICHQWNIPFANPLVALAANTAHRRLFKNFDLLWVPDHPSPHDLGGKMTNNITVKHRYIGHLSRFVTTNVTPNKNNILAILSGPEPQRTILENLLIKKLKNLDHYNSHIVQGKIKGPEAQTTFLSDKLQITNYLNTKRLEQAIQKAQIIITRAGYSSVMDLTSLRKKAILIPTPGQIEQEYLAKYCSEKKYFVCANQNNLKLKNAIKKLKRHSPFYPTKQTQHLLKIALDELLK